MRTLTHSDHFLETISLQKKTSFHNVENHIVGFHTVATSWAQDLLLPITLILRYSGQGAINLKYDVLFGFTKILRNKLKPRGFFIYQITQAFCWDMKMNLVYILLLRFCSWKNLILSAYTLKNP